MIILYNDQQRLVIEMLSVKLWSWQTETKYPSVNESRGFEQFTIGMSARHSQKHVIWFNYGVYVDGWVTVDLLKIEIKLGSNK